MTSITISTPRPAPSFTPVFVAIDRGFLAEEGLQATLKYRLGVEELMRGDLDFLATGHAQVAFLNGADIRMVCGHSTRGGAHVLMVRPEITSLSQLKNVTVGGEENTMELKDILAHHGLSLEKLGITTTLIPGGHPEQFQALKRGVGDGAMLGAPWWIYAAKEGFKNMGSGAEHGPGLPALGIFVTKEKIARYPDQVKGFVRAYAKSMRYCRRDIEGTLQVMVEYSRDWGVDNREIARKVYDLNAPYWSADVDAAAVEKLVKLTSEKLGKPERPVADYLELRFVREALREIT